MNQPIPRPHERPIQRPIPRHGADAVAAISSLGEPTRRALYDFVVASADWVSRDRAAEAVGIERGTAAHHLDRLAADGLLDVDYQRLSGRQGPGAGRPAKLYRRARHDIDVTLPRRDYVLAGRLLAEAADRSRRDGIDIQTALDDAAGAEGRRLADEIRRRRPVPLDGGVQHQVARWTRCSIRSRRTASSRSPTATGSWCCGTARSINSPASTPN